ncbi:crosslink repair DNA glycosylase YcaQ family protein [Streptomyces sp. SL13]|uniref:Crosslink repair DNA glycosylase YcaQ family protein n=1 Tax=Streptantibioticus silvisoli TaxID=2705255 RepID=A0AA90K7X2_9ACTN|nr:crosslink repair DNA glycosylase YcaQ family protein [Streptantibioticus silvisoli]MDI5969373.1 crosslink repair DNA glycosylase YcaQ family protein [Streptantibioticus silvisoli]
MPTPFSGLAIHSLDNEASQGLWNWTLRRQGLADETRFGSVEAIARASLGLHAARLPSPFATVAARSVGADVATSLFSQATRERVITVRCMRKTLHALPLDLAAAAHSATRHYRERDALRAVVNSQAHLAQVEAAGEQIAMLLEVYGPLHHRDIEDRLASRGISSARARLALKLSWERGDIAYRNASDAWNRELRTFALTKQAYPEADLSLDRHHATTVLVETYFDRYGPASLADAVWWSALSRTAITTALAASNREVVTVTTSWSDQPQYMFADRLEEFLAVEPDTHHSGVNFLAHEDVALKAYFETRPRYLGNLPARRAFNQIGEALPTVLHDGQVIGTWAWDGAGRRVTTSMVTGRTSPDIRSAVRTRADQLTRILRSGWTPGHPGRTTMIPGQLTFLPEEIRV